MARKRKAAANPTSDGGKKARLDNTTTETRPFRFLDLAPELRNNIYAHVLQTEPQAYLTPSNRCKLFSKTALSRVNRQVREEFGSLLLVASLKLIAEVTNFDFGHVITFLNRMEQHDLETLPTRDKPAERRMVIKLMMTVGFADVQHLHWPKLRRWLNRLDDPFKNGSSIDFEYAAGGMKSTIRKPLAEKLAAPYDCFSSQYRPRRFTSRARKEKLKMDIAIRTPPAQGPSSGEVIVLD